MFNKLRELREERENGFTLIELLVVILIIGILSAIAIPAFLNQRKSAVDSAVQSDVANAAKQIENYVVKSGATAKPLPSKASLNLVTSDGSNLEISGTTAAYCVIGTNTGGDVAATDGFVYASLDGGMSTKGQDCENGKLTSNAVEVPQEPESEETSNGTVYSGTMASNGTGTINFTFTAEETSPGQFSFTNITVDGEVNSGQLEVRTYNPADPMDENMMQSTGVITVTNGVGAPSSASGAEGSQLIPDVFHGSNGVQYYYYG